jgi:phosphohistidine phosphatase
MFRLYIVRHGPAVELGEKGVETDFDRMLSQDGLIKTRLAASGLRAMNCRPWLILTSPLVRATETADILKDVLQPEKGVGVDERLSPGVPMKQRLAMLLDQPSYPTMVVGHMPDLAELASILVAGKHASFSMTFKKAAACCITFDEEIDYGTGCLDWLIQPRHLRALAE